MRALLRGDRVANPTPSPPGGVAFDTPGEIAASAARIRERTAVTQTMPPSNKTRITEHERAVLATWIERGASRR